MNFLAHLYLSDTDTDIMVGNFIGDLVKGKDLANQFNKHVVLGIELHRSIDAFTDTHPIVSLSKKRLFPKYRHYAAVIVDIYYDHFLARNWASYHSDTLSNYADTCYAMLQTRLEELPQEVQYVLPYMIKGNWLVNYATTAGIHRALSGMARRTSFVSKMEEAVGDLELYYADFEDEFKLFFPELVNHCNQWRVQANLR
jgi:acyl carrier protein phosphodiesterase